MGFKKLKSPPIRWNRIGGPAASRSFLPLAGPDTVFILGKSPTEVKQGRLSQSGKIVRIIEAFIYN